MRPLPRQHAGWAVLVVLLTAATVACRESAPRVQAADSPAAQDEYAEEAAV